MPQSHPASYLRSHRKRAGLTLQEVARILGYGHPGEISRHEHFTATPAFYAALQYEALYRMPVSALFPALAEKAKHEVDERLARYLDSLKESTATGREAALIARKLEWEWERDNMETCCLSHSHEHREA
jgi:transcriptional regulator with XRE-family HTH domain